MFWTIVLSVFALIAGPYLAGRIMGLQGAWGKSALVGLVTVGLTQIIASLAEHLGPAGDTLALMGGLAAWYKVVHVVHGTDKAETMVFMFWQFFFTTLLVSLFSMWINVSWIWGG
jgi:hypothetical protein